MINRRTFAALGLSAILPLPAWAKDEAWPSKPVSIILPMVPGGIVDILTRIVAERLTIKLGQPFVIENRPGAGGSIGLSAASRATPDGYTVVSAALSVLSSLKHLNTNLNYDWERDLVVASIFWRNTQCLFVSSQHPAQNVSEFIDWAKAQPQTLKYASAGQGTTAHIAAELLKLRTGISGRNVPYRGAPQCAAALIAGEVDFTVDNIGAYGPFLASKQVRALAIASDEQWPKLPDVPTMVQAGIKDTALDVWGCMLFPAGTPQAIVTKFSEAVASIAAEPEVQSRFLTADAQAVSKSIEETTSLAQRDSKRWADIIASAGLKAG